MFKIIVIYELAFLFFWNLLYYSNSGIENWFQEKILTAVFVFLSIFADDQISRFDVIISLINNKRIKIRSSGKLVRDYLYVDDAVNAYYMIMKTLEKYKNKKLLIYNVGSKYNLSVLKLVNLILDLMKKKHLKPIIMNKSKQEINFQKLNDAKIKRELGWKQKVSLKSGLLKTIRWYQDNYKLLKK